MVDSPDLVIIPGAGGCRRVCIRRSACGSIADDGSSSIDRISRSVDLIPCLVIGVILPCQADGLIGHGGSYQVGRCGRCAAVTYTGLHKCAGRYGDKAARSGCLPANGKVKSTRHLQISGGNRIDLSCYQADGAGLDGSTAMETVVIDQRSAGEAVRRCFNACCSQIQTAAVIGCDLEGVVTCCRSDYETLEKESEIRRVIRWSQYPVLL